VGDENGAGPADEQMPFADLTLHPETGELVVAGREPTPLPTMVAAVLGGLLQARGAVVGADEIAAVIARSASRDPAATAIRKVRRRLEEAGSGVLVVNVHGQGWRVVEPTAAALSFADLTLDPASRRLVVEAGEPVTVGANISAVLALLLQAGGQVVTATQIEAAAGATSAAAAVHDLSRRLERVGSRVRVVNGHGRGWWLVDPGSGAAGLSFADLQLDPRARRLVVGTGEPTTVGANVNAVLELLLRHGGAFVTATQVEAVAGATPAAAAMHDLIRRLERAGAQARVVNVHGRGWRLVDPATAGEWLSFADLKLDPVTRLLTVTGRDPLTLSAQKSAVLALLIQAQGRPVGAPQIARWSGGTTPGVAVHDLGRRLEQAGSSVVIVNDHGRGWQLVDSVTAGDWLSFADLKFDPVTRTLVVDGQAPVTLSAAKGAVLARLIRAGGDFVTAAEIAGAGPSAATEITGVRRRLVRAATTVTIVHDRKHGWRLSAESGP
jgi:DNA-binding response OmpR family regulator